MSNCEYNKDKKILYYDQEENSLMPYECPYQSLTDRHYCKFHDSDYAQNNPDQVMDSINALVKMAKENKEPLNCMGFNIPAEFSIQIVL